MANETLRRNTPPEDGGDDDHDADRPYAQGPAPLGPGQAQAHARVRRRGRRGRSDPVATRGATGSDACPTFELTRD